MLRETTAVALSSFLALGPSASAWAAPSNGTVSGQVTVEGRPLQGMGLAVVDLKSGQIHRTKSDAKGNYRLRVQPGEYVVTSLSLAGLAVGKAPSRVVVESGRVVVASLELMRLPIAFQQQPPAPQQTPPPVSGPQTYGNITHEPIGCLVAGQFWLAEATIDLPPASIARTRLYFKSELAPQYYFVEGTLSAESASRIGGTKVAASQIGGTLLAAAQATKAKAIHKGPKPAIQALFVTYYLFAITTADPPVESQTPEYRAQVVADESECPEGLKVAPIGPAGPISVFSAASGLQTTALLGFGGAGLGALALGALGLTALLGGEIVRRQVTEDRPTATTTTIITTTPTTTSTTTTTTTTTVPPRACEYVIANCNFDPVSQQPNNCPCLPVGERCATRVVGQPCPMDFPRDNVTECCSNATTCSQIGQPSLPAPRNEPCDRSLPPVIIGK